jgi:glycosyltransferase involved in cell wall biosynthesis
MTADTLGGVWTYAIDLCRGLANYGVQVVMLSMGRLPDEHQSREAARLPNLTLVPTEYHLEWMSGCESDLARSGELLLALEQEFRPDIVHLNTYWHATLQLDTPVLLAAHSCVPSWWAACRGSELPEEWSSYRAMLRKSLESADILVAPSAAYLREFQRLHGAAPHWRLIRNGRDPGLFRNGPKRDMVLAAGRIWDEAKNIRLLSQAAHGVSMPIVVAGDATGPNGESAPAKNVTLLGRLAPAELAKWMACASIFVAPARYEPFGLTVLEAALSGCALVLGDIPTLRELWDGAALFVSPSDPDQLRSVLCELADQPARSAELGAKACARAAHYSLARMARSYYQTYCSLLSSSVEAVA